MGYQRLPFEWSYLISLIFSFLIYKMEKVILTFWIYFDSYIIWYTEGDYHNALVIAITESQLTDTITWYNPSYNLKYLPRLFIALMIINVNPRTRLDKIFIVDPNEHSSWSFFHYDVPSWWMFEGLCLGILHSVLLNRKC